MNDSDQISDDDADINAAREEGAPEDELVTKLKSRERLGRRHSSKWRKDAKDDYDMVAGEQWSAEDKARLLEELRIPIVFNRMAPMVDAVAGAEILNRKSTRFIPRTLGAVKVNEILTGANDWAREQTDAEDEESDSFMDSLTCGMGWVETRMDYDDEPAGMIRMDRIDPLEMYWDPTCKKRNLADRRWQWRGRWMTKADFKAKYPGKLDQVINSLDAQPTNDGDITETLRFPDDEYAHEQDGYDASKDWQRGQLYVRHHQWFDYAPNYRVENPATGQVDGMSGEEYKNVVKMALIAGMQPPRRIKGTKKVYKEAFICGNVALEKRDMDNGFTIECITGKRDRNRNSWYGIVRAMKDPQRWANKWLSQILHILNTNAKGGVLAEEGAFADIRKAEQNWSDPGAIIHVKKGKLDAIRERQATVFPMGIEKLMEFAVTSMPQVTGINLELLGLVQREQPGVLEGQRKQAGYAILAVHFDALRRYRKRQGRIMLDYIREYLSDGRLIRVVGQDGEQYVPLVHNAQTSEYDVIVDEAPMSANQKELVWGMLVQMLPILQQAQMPPDVWAEFVKYSPLPSSLGDKIAQAITQKPPPDPEQQIAKQLMVEKIAAQTEKDRSIAGENWAKVHEHHADALATVFQAGQAASQAMAQPVQPQTGAPAPMGPGGSPMPPQQPMPMQRAA